MSYKLFVTSSNVAYNGSGTQVATGWNNLSAANKANYFINNGTTDDTFTLSSSIGTGKLYIYSTEAEATHTCTLSVLPKNQTVIPSGLIKLDRYDGIESVNIVTNLAGSAAVRIAVTPDLTNWYTWSNNTWTAMNIANIHTSGIPAANISSIENWDMFTDTIGFAYGLSISSLSDTCEVDQLDLIVTAQGSWAKATESQAKYKYQGNSTLVVSLLADGDYKINYVA